MKRKVAVSFMIMALVCALVGGATFAIFTSTATNTNNTFSTGTLDISTGDVQTGGINISNIAPGDTVNGSFIIKNDGNLDLWYKVTPQTSGALFAGVKPATVAASSAWAQLAAGANTTFNYTVSLPIEAGNEYQGVSGSINFVVNAEQYKNNPNPGTLQ